jgi:hypothetical protein
MAPTPVAEADICERSPSTTNRPAVVTVTGPPRAVPAIVLAICAPATIVISGALTVTEPALPLAKAPAEALIAVPGSVSVKVPCEITRTIPPGPLRVLPALISPPLLSVVLPAMATFSAPPAPDEALLLEIAPPLLRASEPALTSTEPAFPVLSLVVLATMPCGEALIDNGPATRTMTLPPSPGPRVPLDTEPPLVIDSAPALR